MPPPKGVGLYGIQRQNKLGNGKEIGSSTSLAFTSQLSSLIASNRSAEPRTRSDKKLKKDDIFSVHNRGAAKRAKKDLEGSAALALSTQNDKGKPLDKGTWEQSQRKMEAKSRLYAAMKRGDVEDTEDRYAVDFDRKWVEASGNRGTATHQDDEEMDESDDEQDDIISNGDHLRSDRHNDIENSRKEIEFIDEFGRTRIGTAADAARAKRVALGQRDLQSDRFTARPTAPASVIYGDTIQHQAFNPDEIRAAQMEELAQKRDKSLTPPPSEHFDASKEIRTKGTGFFQFSNDTAERQRQMDELTRERNETARKRQEQTDRLESRKRQIQARRADLNDRRGKRKADDFLEELGAELAVSTTSSATEMTQRIEAAITNELDDT